MPSFNKDLVNQLKELLTTTSNILITTHYNPDGDALGSSLGLYHYLHLKGYSAKILVPNEYPDFLGWMPGNSDMTVYSKNQSEGDALIDWAEVIFCLDYNAIQRVNLFSDKLINAKGVKVLVDHHLQPEPQFDYMFSMIETSSTSELVYDLICALGDQDIIEKNIAMCLYVGIMTDTGSFSFACNLPHTYEVVAELVRRGVDTEQVHRLVYDTYSEQRMRLLGHCLSEKLTVVKDCATAYIWLSKDDMKKFKVQPGDTEGIVNYALSIKGISFAALFTEKPDKVRISFRSKGNFSVNDFSRNHFNGGGHRNAAGGETRLKMNETIELFTSLLPQYKAGLQSAAHQSSFLQP
ncbi:MAG: DHH family phosphoesterase [Bacteroidetes bacterium HGW-Bacteroidetes-11]|nr:MAG: DHH family phosphoesterase [Bacteroidetes bacterium HGW-Bacteroidetes-11]